MFLLTGQFKNDLKLHFQIDKKSKNALAKTSCIIIQINGSLLNHESKSILFLP